VPFRAAWWITAGAASVLLVLRCIQWSRGRHSVPDLLVPCGLLALSVGSLVRPVGVRKPLLSMGVVLVIIALILRYQS
jgi:hypothetical protein